MASRAYLDAEPKLLWSPDTVLRIQTEPGIWVTHPGLALWIAPLAPNRYVACRGGRVCSFLVRGASPSRFDGCFAARVTPALHDTLLEIAARGHHGTGGPRGPWRSDPESLMQHALAELEPTALAPLPDPFGAIDVRLLPLVEALRDDPTDARSFGEWSALLQLSSRTLTRLFRSSTGLSFGAWRRHVRLLHAVERLALGDDVASVARRLGYESVSMFVSIFRRTLGVTPARYFPTPSILPAGVSEVCENRAVRRQQGRP